jgi:hypothetical protein
MEKLSADVPKKKVVKEADALRSYIYARRHFGSGESAHVPSLLPSLSQG